MGLAHMGTNGQKRGGSSLTAFLNSALVDPLEDPHIQAKGGMLAGMATSKAWKTAKEGSSCVCTPPSVVGVEDSRSAFSGSCRGVWLWWWWGLIDAFWQEVGLLTQRNEKGHPARACTSLLPWNWPPTAPPSGDLQSQGAELLPTTGWPNAKHAVPEKRGERSVTKVRLSHETAKE